MVYKHIVGKKIKVSEEETLIMENPQLPLTYCKGFSPNYI